MADAAEQLDLVLLEALPRTAPETEATAGQFTRNVADRDRQVRGQTFDDDHQGLTVTFAGGQVAQHGRQAIGDVDRARRALQHA